MVLAFDSKEPFEQFLAENKDKRAVVVLFYQGFYRNGDCDYIYQIFDELEKEFENVAFALVDAREAERESNWTEPETVYLEEAAQIGCIFKGEELKTVRIVYSEDNQII